MPIRPLSSTAERGRNEGPEGGTASGFFEMKTRAGDVRHAVSAVVVFRCLAHRSGGVFRAVLAHQEGKPA